MQIDNIDQESEKINPQGTFNINQVSTFQNESAKPEGYIAPELIKVSYPPTNPNGNSANLIVGLGEY